LSVTYQYDSFDKKIAQTRADGLQTRFIHSYDNTVAESLYKLTVSEDGKGDVVTYYDRYDKEIRVEKIGFNGQKVITTIGYDTQGNIIQKSLPYYEGDTAYYITYTYDMYNRPSSVVSPRNSTQSVTQSIIYEGLKTTTSKPNGTSKAVYKNAIGKVIKIEEDDTTTLYAYDAAGNLIKTTDSEGNENTLRYDNAGNKIYMHDLDMGEWSYSYNALGEMISQSDANGNTITFVYDKLGRKIEERSGDTVSTWLYDTLHKGSLSSESKTKNGMQVSRKVYAYDDLGRVVKTLSTLDNQTFSTEYRYDRYSRLVETINPGSFTTINSYDAYGYLSAIKSPKAQIEDYDPLQIQNAIDSALSQQLEYQIQANDYLRQAQELQAEARRYNQIADLYESQTDAVTIEILRENASDLTRYAAQFELRAATYQRYADYYKQEADKYLQYVQMYSGYEWVEVYTWIAERYNAYADEYARSANENLSIALEARAALEGENTFDPTVDYAQIVTTYRQHAVDALIEAQNALNLSEHFQHLADQLGSQTGSIEMLADADYVTFYKVVAIDALDRVTQHISGNGLITQKTYDIGELSTIKTGYDSSRTIRDLHFEYDDSSNLTYRRDNHLDITANYTYDTLDRLINADITTKAGAQNLTYRYDRLGNITYKSDVGDYTYSTLHPHQVVSAGANSYTYDHNGNMTTNANADKTITYSYFNKPVSIQTANDTIHFHYDQNKKRYKKERSDETIYYVGKQYEKVIKANDLNEEKYYIYAEGKVAAIYTRTLNEATTQYLHYDNLGSVDTITSSIGAITQRSAYQPFGKRIQVDSEGYQTTERPITLRGYTGHEHIHEAGLIHMNGRVYDPTLGRFLSADPFIQDPYDSQSFNRYSYVKNNPLKYTDPSGYFSLGGFLSDLWKGIKDVVVPVVIVIASIYTGGLAASAMGFAYGTAGYAVAAGAVAGFVGGVASAKIQGASWSQAFRAGAKGAMWGGISAGVAYGVGEAFGHGTSFFSAKGAQGFAQATQKAIAHGVTRGIITQAQGGNFRAGFWSGFASSGFSVGTKGYGNQYSRAAIMAVVGGTVSEVTGGKFANGAVTGAFVHLFNDAMLDAEREAFVLKRVRNILNDPHVTDEYKSKIQVLLTTNKIYYTDDGFAEASGSGATEGTMIKNVFFGTSSLSSGRIRITGEIWRHPNIGRSIERIGKEVDFTFLHEVKHLITKSIYHPGGRLAFDQDIYDMGYYPVILPASYIK
jgi:RHS repeat-associated protein